MAAAKLLAWGVDATLAQGSYDFDTIFLDFYNESAPLRQVSAWVEPASRKTWGAAARSAAPPCAACGAAPALVLGTWLDTRARASFSACACEPALRELPRFRSPDRCFDAADEDTGKLIVLNGRMFECSAVLLPSVAREDAALP
jgi:hypothetical protein